MEFSLENLGLVNPSDLAPAASPGSGPPLPPSGSSSSSASLLASDDVRCQCQQCHRRISKLVYDRHAFCTCCRSVECSADSRCDECADWSREEMDVYVKHRRSLKWKDVKVKDPLPRPPSPSESSVPSSHPAVASGDDVNRCIAQLGQELSMSFTRQFNDLSSFLRNYLISLVRLWLPRLLCLILLLSSSGSFHFWPDTRSAAVSPPTCSNCRSPPRVSGAGWGWPGAFDDCTPPSQWWVVS